MCDVQVLTHPHQELRQILDHIGRLTADRNKITHAIWAKGDDDAHLARIRVSASAKKGYDREEVQVSIATLQQLAADLLDATHQLKGFKRRHDYTFGDHV